MQLLRVSKESPRCNSPTTSTASLPVAALKLGVPRAGKFSYATYEPNKATEVLHRTGQSYNEPVSVVQARGIRCAVSCHVLGQAYSVSGSGSKP